MGVISLTLTAPASTAKANAVSATVMIGPGHIKDAIVQFPAGCQFLAKLGIYLSQPGDEKQLILPQYNAESGQDHIALDDTGGALRLPIEIELDFVAKLTAELWNDDTVNAHTVKALINLENKAGQSIEKFQALAALQGENF